MWPEKRASKYQYAQLAFRMYMKYYYIYYFNFVCTILQSSRMWMFHYGCIRDAVLTWKYMDLNEFFERTCKTNLFFFTFNL